MVPRYPRLLLLLLLNIITLSQSYSQNSVPGCGDNYFKGSYSPLLNGNVSLLSTALGPDGSVYIGCIANSSYSIMKLDASGNLIRTTSYLPSGMTKSDGSGKMIIDQDGNLFSVFSNNYIIRTDTAGNVLSARQLFNGGTSLGLVEVSMLANGDKVFLFSGIAANGLRCYYLVVTNPDASSTRWTKYLYTHNYIHGDILADGNKIIIGVSVVQSFYAPDGTGMIQLDAGTGAILHQQWFAEQLSFNQISRYKNGYIFAGNSQRPSICGFYARTDTELKPISIQHFPVYFDVDIVYHYLLQPQSDGSLYGVSSHPNALNLFRINENDVIDWTSGLLPASYPTTPKSLTLSASGILIGADLTTNSGLTVAIPALQLFKGSYSGYFPSCVNPVASTTSMSVLPMTQKNAFTQFRDTTAFTSIQIFVLASDLSLTGNICSPLPACNSIKIVGDPIVCSGSGTFMCNKNSSCSLPITWSVTGGSGTTVIQDASTNAVTINFSRDGIYKVKAMIGADCSNLGDSLLVHVNMGSGVILGNDTLLCAGDSLRLRPGNNFSTYTWQDASTDSTFLVTNPGQFSVTTKDYCGNVTTDDINISFRSPVASPFLPNDTTICQYGTVKLQTNTKFNSYLWNDGTKSPSLLAHSAGMYYLQVVDENRCTGRDSIIVTGKQCMIGFYVPNAFSPNNDGKNDFLRPMIYGNVTSFSFIIYNRWGQQVFASSEPLKGWDGTLHGTLQPAGGFVWVCSYQLQGEKTKTQRGTVLMIR